MCAAGAVVSSWSLLIRRLQRACRQAEAPLIVLCKFAGPALIIQRFPTRCATAHASRSVLGASLRLYSSSRAVCRAAAIPRTGAGSDPTPLSATPSFFRIFFNFLLGCFVVG